MVLSNSVAADLDGMNSAELRALVRSLDAEVRTLRSLRRQDRTIATQALMQIQGSDRMPPPSAYGCPSEAH